MWFCSLSLPPLSVWASCHVASLCHRLSPHPLPHVCCCLFTWVSCSWTVFLKLVCFIVSGSCKSYIRVFILCFHFNNNLVISMCIFGSCGSSPYNKGIFRAAFACVKAPSWGHQIMACGASSWWGPLVHGSHGGDRWEDRSWGGAGQSDNNNLWFWCQHCSLCCESVDSVTLLTALWREGRCLTTSSHSWGYGGTARSRPCSRVCSWWGVGRVWPRQLGPKA